MFAPFGGMKLMRQRVLKASFVKRNHRVLELGCGPGELTALLLERGATVVAVDSSEQMIAAASKRAPAATYEIEDIRSYVPNDTYDLVVFAFVLHEIPKEELPGIIEKAAASLDPNGHIAILDHALPPGIRGVIWETLLQIIEPRTVEDWLTLRVPELLRSSGLRMGSQHSLAGGRARLFVARRFPIATPQAPAGPVLQASYGLRR